MSVQIEKIRIKIGEKELDLSIEEAKELQSVLNDLFKVKEVDPPYVYPIWVTHTWPEYPYKRWDVYYTCDNTILSSDLDGSIFTEENGITTLHIER